MCLWSCKLVLVISTLPGGRHASSCLQRTVENLCSPVPGRHVCLGPKHYNKELDLGHPRKQFAHVALFLQYPPSLVRITAKSLLALAACGPGTCTRTGHVMCALPSMTSGWLPNISWLLLKCRIACQWWPIASEQHHQLHTVARPINVMNAVYSCQVMLPVSCVLTCSVHQLNESRSLSLGLLPGKVKPGCSQTQPDTPARVPVKTAMGSVHYAAQWNRGQAQRPQTSMSGMLAACFGGVGRGMACCCLGGGAARIGKQDRLQ